MSKMDRQGARTPADLERKYNFGKSFAELRNIALDAQTHVYTLEETVKRWSQTVGSELEGVYAQLELKVDSEQVVSMINASADVITLNSNRLVVNSDNFALTADGTITAKAGYIGEWVISSEGLSKSRSWLDGDFYTTETTAIFPNGISCSVSSLLSDRRVEIANGEINVARAGTADITTINGFTGIPFMTVTTSSNKYQIYLDTQSLTIKARIIA